VYIFLTEFGLNISKIYGGNEFAKSEQSQFRVLESVCYLGLSKILNFSGWQGFIDQSISLK